MANLETASPKKTLIEHTDDLNALMNKADSLAQAGEDVPAELMDQITEALTQQGEKVDRCAAWVSRAMAEIVWLKEEKASIDAQIRRVERTIERMNYLAGVVMDIAQLDKLEGLKGHSFRWNHSSAVGEVDVDALPEEYKSTETKVVVDRKKLRDALMAGKDVPGACLDKRRRVVCR